MAKSKLVDFLRTVADQIEKDETVIEPDRILLVLSNQSDNEVIWCNHNETDQFMNDGRSAYLAAMGYNDINKNNLCDND